jgi:hypothetical protein
MYCGRPFALACGLLGCSSGGVSSCARIPFLFAYRLSVLVSTQPRVPRLVQRAVRTSTPLQFRFRDPTDRVAANEIAEGRAARRVAQVDLTRSHHGRAGGGLHAGEWATVTVTAAQSRGAAIEVRARRPAGELFERRIALQVREPHPTGLARDGRHAVAPDEAVDRRPQRWRVQAPGIKRRLAPEVLIGGQLDRFAASGQHGRRPHARPEPSAVDRTARHGS